MRILGVDPDLHNTALAILDGLPGSFTIYYTKIVSISSKIKGDKAIAEMSKLLLEEAGKIKHLLGGQVDFCYVESPKLHPSTGFTKQAGVMKLAHIAGACACACSTLGPIKLIDPATWKGQVPKNIHHKRLLRKWGIPFEVVKSGKTKPDWPYNVTESFHLIDAIGIAEKGLAIEAE